jgi:predicted enzyme related to lactoylglutathione lyase
MQHLINWIEIPATDLKRAATFYKQVLGMELKEVDMFGTRMAFFPNDGTNVSGALVKGADYIPSGEGPLVYLNGGNDLELQLSKVEAAGGKVVVEKTQISQEMGYFAIFIDCEGNKMALHSIG